MEDPVWRMVRENIIGNNSYICTPFGQRKLTYADYTASGRGLRFIEQYLMHVLNLYANTHTDDDTTGIVTTRRFHRAEEIIKECVNADDRYGIIETGSGATGGIKKLQQILGIYVPAAVGECIKKTYRGTPYLDQFYHLEEHFKEKRPVVFVGPYEHHSNEISWRESLAEVVSISLDTRGHLDLEDLSKKIADPRYKDRMKIGSFSAASNVTGIHTPVYKVARILHRNGALVFFDFAASAPYEEINVNKGPELYFDGCFFSPHKFLGGPGSTGLLIFRKEIYPTHLPPTFAGGGTVDFVNLETQDYLSDIEEREKAGTPPILQTMKAALVLDLKAKLGQEAIKLRERQYISIAMARLSEYQQIEILGDPDPSARIGILSFNIKAGEGYLHPRFIVRLLNDLFGIQSRGGCSCAGPYGHRLLNIDEATSYEFRKVILSGKDGVKPGWARINLHFLMTEEELNFIIESIIFIALYGKYFLQDYEFDLSSGRWTTPYSREPDIKFGIDEAVTFDKSSVDTLPGSDMLSTGKKGEPSQSKDEYKRYLNDARTLAEERRRGFDPHSLHYTDKHLVPFVYIHLREE